MRSIFVRAFAQQSEYWEFYWSLWRALCAVTSTKYSQQWVRGKSMKDPLKEELIEVLWFERTDRGCNTPTNYIQVAGCLIK